MAPSKIFLAPDGRALNRDNSESLGRDNNLQEQIEQEMQEIPANNDGDVDVNNQEQSISKSEPVMFMQNGSSMKDHRVNSTEMTVAVNPVAETIN